MACSSGCLTQDHANWTCSGCGMERACDEWYYRKSGVNQGTRMTPCKECSKRQRVAWSRANPEKNAKAAREHRRKNPRAYRDQRLRRDYGISLERYEQILEGQGGSCAICGTTDPRGKGTFHVDHDHSCCPTPRHSCGSCIRGLLCVRCNSGLGMFNDDAELVQAGVAYLRNRDRVEV